MSLLFLVVSLVLSSCSTSISGGGNGNSTNANNSNASSSSNNANSGGSASNGSSNSSRTTPVPAVVVTGKHVGPASLYPDPNLTPGDTFPGVTAKEVCVSGYTKTVRNVSSEEKAAVFQRYAIPDVAGKYEVDHFVSLELGGSNDVKNLWPEPYEPLPGARQKDTVENALHAEVCNGGMTLAQAQSTIKADWYAYYLKIHSGK